MSSSKSEDNFQKLVDKGMTQEALVLELHRQGFSIISSIQKIKELFNIGLGEAKEIVSRASCWDGPGHENFQNAIIDAANEAAEGVGSKNSAD